MENKKRKKDAPPSTMETPQNSLNADKNYITKKSKSQDKESKTKKRNWAFLVYPESAPEDWREILQKTGLQIAISPLHDKDLNATGEPKKAHWHIIACYSGPTSYGVVKSLTERLNAPIPQALEQVRGYYRYLTHKDNPEKVQYDEKDIDCLNGFSILDFVEITKSEALAIKKELLLFIRKNYITEYADLIDYAMFNLSDAHFEIAVNNTMLFTNTIKSKRHKRERIFKGEKMIDYATGQLLTKDDLQ